MPASATRSWPACCRSTSAPRGRPATIASSSTRSRAARRPRRATPESIREGYDLATALHDDARADALLVALVDFSNGEAGKGEAVWGLIELGKRCRARGDFEGAHGRFARALELTDPERVEPHLRQLAADVREREGDSSLAARIYETLRARVPGNAGLWNDLFELYARIDDLASCDRLARERLDQLMEPEARTEIRMRVARLRLAKDPTDPNGLDALRDTLLDDPCYLEAGKMLARHYEAVGDVEALVDLREGQLKALEDKHDHVHVALVAGALGRALTGAGQFERALSPYRRALAVSAGNKPLLEEIFAVLHTATARRAELENPAEALALARDALKAAGDDRRARTQAAELVAKLLADQEEYAAAIQLLLDTLPLRRRPIASNCKPRSRPCASSPRRPRPTPRASCSRICRKSPTTVQ